MLSPERRLVYAFMSLSYVSKANIAREMGLGDKIDEATSLDGDKRAFFVAVKDQEKLGELWSRVAGVVAEGRADHIVHLFSATEPNPFIKEEDECDTNAEHVTSGTTPQTSAPSVGPNSSERSMPMAERFEDTVALFGGGSGGGTYGDIECGICRTKYNEGEDERGVYDGESVCNQNFAGMTVCECCFIKIEEEIWHRSRDVTRWLRRRALATAREMDQLVTGSPDLEDLPES